MRVLFLNHNVVGTGTYQRASNLARELGRAGHDVTLVTTSRRNRVQPLEATIDGVRLIEAPDLLAGGARNGWDPWNTLWRTRRLSPEHFDLVHAFDCRPAVLGPALVQRRRTGAPLYFDWADWWGRGGTISERSSWPVRAAFGPVETWLEEAFRATATANTTISEALRQRCIALGVAPARVVALPNGCVPPSALRPDRGWARKALGVSEDPLVVHLGVMQRADAVFLFTAFRLLRARRLTTRLVLMGNYSGPIPDDIAGAVVRTGYVTTETMRLWLAAADAAVVPLRDTVASRGRWPGKVNEYLSAGVPTVIPEVGAVAQVIADADAGVVCSATSAALANALEQVLADDDARERMSRNAVALAAGSLAWSAIAQRLLSFYARWSSGETRTRAVVGEGMV